jgi:hypothetical protein
MVSVGLVLVILGLVLVVQQQPAEATSGGPYKLTHKTTTYTARCPAGSTVRITSVGQDYAGIMHRWGSFGTWHYRSSTKYIFVTDTKMREAAVSAYLISGAGSGEWKWNCVAAGAQ